jgi:glycerophosphoryl diester phosphodiesterase
MEISRNPLIIAHRGGAALAPENTLFAIEKAINLGADGVEFDLQITRDGEIVLYHDDRLNPQTTRQGSHRLETPTPRIRELTLAELKRLDLGYDDRYANSVDYPEFQTNPGEPIASFEAFMALILEKAPANFKLFAELKTNLVSLHEAEALAAAFKQKINAYNLADRAHIVSFNWNCLSAIRQSYPDIAHAYTSLPFHKTDPDLKNTRETDETRLIRAASANGAPWWGSYDWRDQTGDSHAERVIRAIAAASGKGWFAFHEDINAQTMTLAQDLGLEVSAWTVNDTQTMQRLADLGVAAIITDRPDLAIQHFS